MPEKTQAEIVYSLVEYTAAFKRPLFGAPSPPHALIAGVLDALEPLGYAFGGVEITAPQTQTLNLGDLAVIFRRAHPAVPARSFALSLSKIYVRAENLDWAEADQFAASHVAAVQAVREKGGAEIQSQQLVVQMHIQLKERSRKDVTVPLLSPVALKLLEGEPDFSGVVLYQGKAVLVIDASAAYANGLFVRISREHPAHATLQDLAAALRADEERVFGVLGLEGEL
jgi:hypothetical protein